MALGLGIEFPFFARNEGCRWNPSIVKTTSSTSLHIQSPSPSSAGYGATYQDDCSQRFSLELRLWFIAGAAEVR